MFRPRSIVVECLIAALLVLTGPSAIAWVNIEVWTGSGTHEGIVDNSNVYLPATPEAALVLVIKTATGSIREIGSFPPYYLGAGETLVATSEIGHNWAGSAEGRFHQDVAAETGDVIYVRAFNSDVIAGATYYGNSGATYTVGAELYQIWNINGGGDVNAFKTNKPLDLVPPGAPTGFSAVPEATGDIYLSWTNTSEADVSSVEVWYRNDGRYPTMESDGARVIRKPASPSDADSHTHASLVSGSIYHYSIFSIDRAGNFSTSYATAQATSSDTVSPEVVDHSPKGAGLDTNTDAMIYFSERMNQSSAQSAFSIYPFVPVQGYNWSGDGKTMQVVLDRLSNSTRYTVSIEVTALDLAGNRLDPTPEAYPKPFTFSFMTEAPPPDITAPRIYNFMIDGRPIINGDIISKTPRITAFITDEAGAGSISSIEFTANGVTKYFGSPGPAFNTATGTFEFAVPATEALHQGNYTLRLIAWDPSSNSTEEVRIHIKVFPDEVGLEGPARNYPNPFHSHKEPKGTTIAYDLRSDFEVTLYLYDITAHLVWKKAFPAWAEGGHAGYNEVFWDGKNVYGEEVPNGIYLLKLVGGGKVLGTSTLTVLD